jgi:hypothetical protein
MEDQDIVRVHVIVPEGFDDPGQPTGGNIYDRRVCAGLAEAGWEVLVATVAAAWPVRGSGARADLARVVSAIPDGETVLIDGLVASPAAAQLLPHTGRIRMTVLLHMPLATAVDTHHDASAERSERVVLRAAAGVVVTSEWTRRQVLTRYAIASAVGGRPEAFGSTADGTGPGQLIPPGDPAALAAALGDWLDDEDHRHRLRAAVRQRQPTLRGWEQTTQEIADALTA